MEFFHPHIRQYPQNLLISFNIEGYNRNLFYLHHILNKYSPVFLFLQEHRLPEHEAYNKFFPDFENYNFIVTSSDMLTQTEDRMLNICTSWHGTALALGWSNKIEM